jgi:hypothetical protein
MRKDEGGVLKRLRRHRKAKNQEEPQRGREGRTEARVHLNGRMGGRQQGAVNHSRCW